jgi:lipopolysaccharide export system permease protein
MRIKPKILTLFLARRFLSGLSLVLLIISGIIFAITFVEKLPGRDSAISAASVAFVSLLSYIPMFLPIAVFMGTLLTSYNLTRSSESVIISGAGMSPWQKMRPFVMVAFLLGVFATCVVNPYSVGQSAGNLDIDSFELSDNAIWLREASDISGDAIILRAGGVAVSTDKDLVFSKATAIIQDKDFKFLQRIETDSMRLTKDGLFVKSARSYGPDGIPRTLENWHRESKTSPANFLERHLKPTQVSFWRLPGMIQNMRKIGMPARGHMTQFWTLMFLPMTLIAMTTLGTAFSQTRERRNFSFGTKFAVGILVCFGLYFVMNVFGALGTSGALPTILASAMPPLIITAFVATWIVSFEAI